MKKYLIILSTALLTLTFSGCNKTDTTPKTKATTQIMTLNKPEEKTNIPFEAIDLKTGKTVNSKIFSTKNNNMIVIWKSDCGPCQEELVILQEIQDKYKNIKVIGLSADSDNEVVKKFIAEKKITFENYRLTEDYLKVILTKTTKTPTIFILDKNGIEKYKEIGLSKDAKTTDDIKSHLENLLKQFN